MIECHENLRDIGIGGTPGHMVGDGCGQRRGDLLLISHEPVLPLYETLLVQMLPSMLPQLGLWSSEG